MKGWCAKIVEGKTKLEAMNNKQNGEDGFILDENAENEDTQIPFV